MRTVDVEVLSYAELSPRAQQAVRQQWVEHVPKEEWADWVEDGFKTRVFSARLPGRQRVLLRLRALTVPVLYTQVTPPSANSQRQTQTLNRAERRKQTARARGKGRRT